MITTECMVTELPAEGGAPMGGGMPDMGGMGGMPGMM
jgi:chaperonin GroEL